MISYILKTTAAILFIVATVSAQSSDTSGNASLKGDYFVREVLMTGTPDGSVTAASSAIGIATFDGNGNYTFKGQGTSLAAGPNATLSLTGTYSVGSNGFLKIESLADMEAQRDFNFGGVSAIGPSAFVASATEQTNVTMMIGIPAGANASNGVFKGNYTAGAIDFPNANITSVREATFNLTADGAGNLGNVAVSGAGANLGGNSLNQTASGVTYSLSGEGSGTVNFGAAANSQLVSGTKNFYISADGNIILAGSPTGYDIEVGIRSPPGNTASNATANQLYYMAGLEDFVDPTGQTTNAIDAFYGSENATGSGTSLFHNRINSVMYTAYDYTFDTQYTIAANGTIPVGSGAPYTYTFGVNGQAFVAVGDAVGSAFYSLTLGLGMPKYSGSGVYLLPNGIVNSANFAPATNPIAPNEFITLNGTGLAAAATPATNLPLPTTLGGVQVRINGVLAPLDYVSPTQIIALVPSSVSPANNEYYATVQVINNNVTSNSVTVYTSNTAPGVFANPVAVGAAAAQHGANYSLISAASPANINETIIVYLGGLGAVLPTVADGAPASSNPLSNVLDPNIFVDFSGVQAAYPVPFAGLTPTAAGLYQINVAIPTGTPSNVFVEVSTTDGFTSQATLNVAGTGAAVANEVELSHLAKQRMSRRRAQEKKAGLKARAN